VHLSEYISTIAATFERAGGMSAPAQQLLRRADAELRDLAPIGFITTGSGGRGVVATIPWFGFLDPDETTTPLEGLYVVYLFTADLGAVYLTLIQGVTFVLERIHPPADARARLAADGQRIREQLGADRLAGLLTAIDLRAGGRLPAGYESGAVAAIEYAVAGLPDNATLEADLERMLGLYQDAILAKRALLTTDPGSIATPAGSHSGRSDDAPALDHFKPKSSADYVTHVTGGTFVRTRRHEALIKEYGEWARGAGFSASTAEHPKDLVLRLDGVEWLIEGEVVRRGNAAHAVREAIGQLFEYRRFLYTDQAKASPNLVALFSESIGDAYLALLAELGILAIWRDAAEWRGCPAATVAGIAANAP
jgi:hypothetical protein